jgi:hypothetical protein
MKPRILLPCLLLLFTTAMFAQKPIRYYRVDSVKTVKGEIVEIKSETGHNKGNFTVIYLKEKKSGEIYKVEVSPEWFFNMDLMEGSYIEITGSCTLEDGTNLVMTRSIAFQGELYEFRDKYGFPLWRGKGKHANRGAKGNMRRRGRN